MAPTIAVLTTLAVHLGTVQLVAGPEPAEPDVAEPDVAEPDVPEGTVVVTPSTTGTTEVEGQGKFAAADVDARKAKDATELEISAGGMFSSGNAFSANMTGAGRFRLRRGIHQIGSQAAANYGIADVTVTDEQTGIESSEREPTVSNVQGMARYDVFFAERWSAFLMATARRDRFQGLDLRFNLDPGVAFHVLSRARHRLWVEAGYDFQYDVRSDEIIADGNEPTLVNHAARLFFGYNNSLSQRASLDTQLEYLQSVIKGTRFRINWVNALTIQLANRLGLSTTFTLRYENEPVVAEKLDTITAVLLTIRFI